MALIEGRYLPEDQRTRDPNTGYWITRDPSDSATWEAYDTALTALQRKVCYEWDLSEDDSILQDTTPITDSEWIDLGRECYQHYDSVKLGDKDITLTHSAICDELIRMIEERDRAIAILDSALSACVASHDAYVLNCREWHI